eukprot:4640790-Amphidinium_carterae.1
MKVRRKFSKAVEGSRLRCTYKGSRDQGCTGRSGNSAGGRWRLPSGAEPPAAATIAKSGGVGPEH